MLAANRNRYLKVTEQVRRMPVYLSVVLDQMYAPDLLVALANMPLRFQTTQDYWQRFRGTLPTGAAAGGETPDATPIRTSSEGGAPDVPPRLGSGRPAGGRPRR